MGKRRAHDAGDDDDEPPAKQQAAGDRRGVFVQHVKALNNQFSAWVKQQAQSSQLDLWTTGLEDYQKYAKKIQDDFADVIKSGGAATAAPAAPAAPLFGAPAATTTPAAGGLFSFGGAAAAAPAPAKENYNPFFGGAAPSAAAAAPTFGGGGAMFGGLISTGGGGGGAGEEDAEPSSPTKIKAANDDGTEDIKMEVKAKFHVMQTGADKGKWSDRGIGHVSVRVAKEADASGKKPARILFRSEMMGKLLVNTRVYKGLKVLLANSAKAGGITMTLYMPEEKKKKKKKEEEEGDDDDEDDAPGGMAPTMVLFKVSKQTDSGSLKEIIEGLSATA